MWGALSGERTGLSFTIAAYPRQRGAHDHILLSQIRDFSNLEGQVPVFISPKNRVTQLYAGALGSFFVASYDSRGYGAGIRTRLHMYLIKPEFHLHNALQETHCVFITTANSLCYLRK
jgi:hypothetical protein